MKKLKEWLGPPKRWIPGLVVALFFVLILAAGGGIYYHIEYNPKFCTSCHIMKEPFRKWQEGTHAMVNCHECHKQSKMESLHQLWLNLTQHPEAVIHHPHLDHTVCARCHMTEEQRWHDIRETAGHKVHFERGGVECLDCHGQGIHNIAKPEGICVTCHSDKTGMHNNMAFMQCTQCHRFLTKGELKPTSEVCKACHEKIRMSRNHPRLKEDADCISCHKPHEM